MLVRFFYCEVGGLGWIFFLISLLLLSSLVLVVVSKVDYARARERDISFGLAGGASSPIRYIPRPRSIFRNYTSQSLCS